MSKGKTSSNMDETSSRFTGFPHEANTIKKYLPATSSGIFTILLKDGSIMNFMPDDPNAFEAWLKSHNIPNIKDGQS